ncbi:MAG: hypothetical protein LBI90_08140, partial [Treponema sp.]|nr:hypothetical protein [Treponema sp.]
TVEIPASHRLDLHLDIPPEFPAGRTTITFTPESEKPAQDDDVTWRLNQYYAGRSRESDSGLQQAAYQLFAREDW